MFDQSIMSFHDLKWYYDRPYRSLISLDMEWMDIGDMEVDLKTTIISVGL